MTTRRDMFRLSAAVVLMASLATPALVAQRPRGGNSGGGASGLSPAPPTRLDVLAQSFTLTKDQQKQVKTLLDAEFKSAAPLREELKKTRTALGMAIQNKKPQTEIDDAVKSYAAQVTAMTEAETKALAKLLQALSADQRGNPQATQSAIYLMRGALAGKKWDTTPDVWFY